jgi:L-lactate dehydrogenase complex protein LldE
MNVQLMLTCLCDAFYGEVGIAAVRVLEHAGCEVSFADAQTCCGQPPFNSGQWDAARTIALHAKKALGAGPIVTPSASCAAMLREGYHMLFPEETPPEAYELCELLVTRLGVSSWPALPKPRSVAFHRACHGRGIGLGDTQERLLGLVGGLTLLPVEQGEQCCGFGGAFSATHAKLSSEIGQEKLKHLRATGATEIVSGDMGCLMHLAGLLGKDGLSVRVKHVAEVLAEALPVEVGVGGGGRGG